MFAKCQPLLPAHLVDDLCIKPVSQRTCMAGATEEGAREKQQPKVDSRWLSMLLFMGIMVWSGRLCSHREREISSFMCNRIKYNRVSVWGSNMRWEYNTSNGNNSSVGGLKSNFFQPGLIFLIFENGVEFSKRAAVATLVETRQCITTKSACEIKEIIKRIPTKTGIL